MVYYIYMSCTQRETGRHILLYIYIDGIKLLLELSHDFMV